MNTRTTIPTQYGTLNVTANGAGAFWVQYDAVTVNRVTYSGSVFVTWTDGALETGAQHSRRVDQPHRLDAGMSESARAKFEAELVRVMDEALTRGDFAEIEENAIRARQEREGDKLRRREAELLRELDEVRAKLAAL